MIGTSFPVFLTLLVLGFISSFVFHVLIRYRMLAGFDGFLYEWIAAWAGGWLGSPVFGHWSMHSGSLYIIPAILGAFAGPFLTTATFKVCAMSVMAVPRPSAASLGGARPRLEVRKAS